jgi:hypothetical protein
MGSAPPANESKIVRVTATGLGMNEEGLSGKEREKDG